MKTYTIHNVTTQCHYSGWQGRSAREVLTRFVRAEPTELMGDSFVEVTDNAGNVSLFNVRLVPIIEKAKAAGLAGKK